MRHSTTTTTTVTPVCLMLNVEESGKITKYIHVYIHTRTSYVRERQLQRKKRKMDERNCIQKEKRW